MKKTEQEKQEKDTILSEKLTPFERNIVMNNYKLACSFNDYELARDRKFVPNSFETSFNLIKTLFRKVEKGFT